MGSQIEELTTRFLSVYQLLLNDEKVSSISDFAKKIDVSSSMLTEIKKGRSKVGLKAIQNTVQVFNEINPDWILTGNGNIKRDSNSVQDNESGTIEELIANRVIKKLEPFLNKIDAMEKSQSLMLNHLSENLLNEISKSIKSEKKNS